MAFGASSTFSALEYIEISLPDNEIPKIAMLSGDPIEQKISIDTLKLEYENTSAANSSSTNNNASGVDYEDTWTLMIYMNGSNLEYTKENDTYDACGSEDIAEMLSSNLSDNVNIVIETGGTISWYRDDINGEYNQRFEIKNQQLNKIEDLDRRNMCDPNTLTSFTDWL